MLNRRHLRIKAMQGIYAYLLAGNTDLAQGEKELLRSIRKFHELFIYQLSYLIEISDFALLRIEESKQKLLPSDEDLNPNTKFVENQFIAKLVNNIDLSSQIDNLKISWIEEKGMTRSIFKGIRESDNYKLYMTSGDNSFEEDKDFVIWLFRNNILNSEKLESYYEELSIFWAGDFYMVASYLVKSLKGINADWNENDELPGINKYWSKKYEDDLSFVKELYRKTILNGKNYEGMIAQKAKNWELDRIAFLDMIVLKLALCEVVEFSQIPIKVSFNEYIEISKDFSTPKSKVFINGVLDRLIDDLKKENKIRKTGRGLLDH